MFNAKTIKFTYYFSILALCLFFALHSRASDAKFVKLSNVQVSKIDAGTAVDLTFDRPVSSRIIKPAFERNFMQLVFKSTKIDAARILSVNGSTQFQKVFAYPYNPETTRVRLIFNTPKAPQGRLTFWNTNPHTVRLLIKEPKAEPQLTAKVEEKNVNENEKELNSNDNELIKEVVNNTKDIDIHNPDSIKAVLSINEKTDTKLESKAEPIGIPSADKVSGVDKNDKMKDEKSIGTKAEPSRNFVKMIVALFAVLAIFFGAVFLLKRYAGKFKKLPFGKKERIIQVIATHHLGNKKSISLVKVAGEFMVVGVGNEGISLISKLDASANIDSYLEDRFWGGTFENHLKSYETDKTIINTQTQIATEQPVIPNKNTAKFKYDGAKDLAGAPITSPLADFSDQISDKVEISSVRTSIKEKLSKLKPLS